MEILQRNLKTKPEAADIFHLKIKTLVADQSLTVVIFFGLIVSDHERNLFINETIINIFILENS